MTEPTAKLAHDIRAIDAKLERLRAKRIARIRQAHDREGLSLAAIAHVLGTTRQAVHQALQRAEAERDHDGTTAT